MISLDSPITTHQLDEGNALLLKSLALREQIGNRVQIAHTLHNLAVNARQQGNYAEADRFLQISLAHYRDMGVVSHAAWEFYLLGNSALDASNFRAARDLYAGGLALVAETEHNRMATDLRSGLAWVAWAQGDYDEAEILAERVHHDSSAINRSQTMRALFLIGSIASARNAYDRARGLFEASMQIGQELANQQAVAECRVSLAVCAFRQDHLDLARQHLQAGLDFYLGDAAHLISDPLLHKRLTAEALCLMGAVESKQGDYATARQHLQKSLSLVRDTPNIATVMGVIGAIAEALVDQSEFERAAELGALIQHRTRSYAVDKTRAVHLLAKLETVLLPDVYATAIEYGAQLDSDAVVAAFLQEEFS
jgi:tetratricopeptide (TPR) repeat protein